jgi:3-(3-hydroxy-phenyl)propionate hydroxylase
MGIVSPADGLRRDHAVVIAGGGPTGLMLAGELALAGVDVAIVERRSNQGLTGSRAGGLHARTIEVLDQRGIADRFLSQGQRSQSVGFHMIRLDISDFPTRHNYLLALWQNHIERILADWVGELGVPIYRGLEVTGFKQDDGGIDVELSDSQRLRADYLVGCDGGRSVIRKAAGIEFAGWDPTMSWMIAEVEMSEEPAWGFRSDAIGIHGLGKMEDGGPVRVVLTEQQLNTGGEPTLCDLSKALTAIYGTDYGVHSPTWLSRFTDMTGRLPPTVTGVSCWPATPPIYILRWAGRGSTSACRTRQIWDGSWPRWLNGPRRKACSTAIMPSVIRSPPASCATRWRRSLFVAPMIAPRLWVRL